MYILSRSNVDEHIPVFEKFDEKPTEDTLYNFFFEYYNEAQSRSTAIDLLDIGEADVPGCRSCTSFKLTKV